MVTEAELDNIIEKYADEAELPEHIEDAEEPPPELPTAEDAEDWEEAPKCPICRSEAEKLPWVKLKGLGNIEVLRCPKCGYRRKVRRIEL